MYTLPPISKEQQNVLNQLSDFKNVTVNSVAGCGKSSTAFHIAKQLDFKNILLLTYNSRLKDETRIKVKSLGLNNNMEVHSYHSFCYTYYTHEAQTDKGLDLIIAEQLKPVKPFDYDLVIVDECQDLSELLFEIVCKIYSDNTGDSKPQICIFGDSNQCIFAYKGANSKYLDLSSSIFKVFNSYEWATASLSTTFRVPSQVVHFINKSLLHYDRMKSSHSNGSKPEYLITDPYTVHRDLIECFRQYKPDDIFILAPSIKAERSPVKKLENYIVSVLKIPVFVSMNEEAVIDDDIIRGKIMISTIHRTKGLERKVVVFFNFDQSYFTYFDKTGKRNVCPNEIYVGATRCKEKLILVHDKKNCILPFIKESTLRETCTIPHDTEFGTSEEVKNVPVESKYTVTGLLAYLPSHVITECLSTIERIQIRPKGSIISILSKKNNEIVADITGIAIPLMLEYRLKGTIDVIEQLKDANFQAKIPLKGKKYNLEVISDALDEGTRLKPSEMLFIANCWRTYIDGYLCKLYQIKKYDWLSPQKMNRCMDRLLSLGITSSSKFEYAVQYQSINGLIDCVDFQTNSVYEFKCVKELSDEHFLQLAIYAYLYDKTKQTKEKTNYYLYNILSDELFQLTIDLSVMKDHVQYMVRLKTENEKPLTSKQFIKECTSITKKYFN